ncbi:hypothetical protein H9Q13_14425 [Pontibacter sp. JH31]|uniref:Uncharacterized protein n=1 Tax=Pontibacter aquaedesilientis TaxID=2766980 RepID=A0ABR7XJD4_9BACT|nr:hypothetical protein [Pontibacter aquaedesilientis]MBD1398363.1 hypothetical protein [Pontibacter aquaedesilientis]
MKRITPLFMLALLICQQAFSQQNIETRLGYHYNDKFEFSDEWQYLSTDIYLYNGGQFNRVLNELETGVKKDRKNRYAYELEHLFITAQLKNLKLFGNDQIVYPLFNFNINRDKNDYHTQVSDHLEVVRIIDKMPLSSAQNNIDAAINAKAVSTQDGDQVFNLVASQLVNLSNLANPSVAVMSLVGEFGNLLSARAKKKEYKFSSTIRLYEGQNFDTRLHSVKVYVFVPGSVKAVTLKPAKLADYLSKNTSKLDRRQLEDAIGYKDYPYIVVANYKSLYKVDVLTGDEVTMDLIEKRRQKIQTAYDTKLMNDETYRQEKLYVEFLRIFAEMKQNLNAYRLNYRNNSPEINAKNLFGIMQEYKRMKTAFEAREKEFDKNTTYKNIFRPEYESILGNADLYLDADHNLKNAKVLVNTLQELENNPKAWDIPAKREAALARLSAVELPRADYLSASVEGEAIVRLTKKLEDLQYREVFEKEVKKLADAQASDETVPMRNALQDKANTSNCVSCRDKVRDAVSEYNKRYESFRLKEEKKEMGALQSAAEEQVLRQLRWQSCFETNLQAVAVASTENGMDKYYSKLNEKSSDFSVTIKELEALVKNEPANPRLQQVQEYNKELKRLMQDAEQHYALLCQLDKKLCQCQ